MAFAPWLLAVVVAQGADEQRAIHLEYSAEPGCIDADSFWWEVQQRAAHVERTTERSRRNLRVAIAAGASGRTEGEIVLVEDDKSSRQAISGESCEEVARALALIAALAIETSAPPPKSVPAREEPAAAEAPVIAASAPPSEPAPRLRLSAGASAGVRGGALPSPAIEPWLFAELESAIRIRAGFGYASQSAARASFSLAVGRIEACPLALSFGPIAAEPCAWVEAGGLSASGLAATDARSGTNLWLAPGLTLRVRFEAGILYVAAEAGSGAPLIRERYYFAPMETVHRVSFLTESASLGLGVNFW
jgi:hypothetical protein